VFSQLGDLIYLPKLTYLLRAERRRGVEQTELVVHILAVGRPQCTVRRTRVRVRRSRRTVREHGARRCPCSAIRARDDGKTNASGKNPVFPGAVLAVTFSGHWYTRERSDGTIPNRRIVNFSAACYFARANDTSSECARDGLGGRENRSRGDGRNRRKRKSEKAEHGVE
jgi:hypothetical protein